MDTYYTYIDWTLEEQPVPFYVGKGNAQRVKRRYRNQLHRHIASTRGMRREVVLETSDEHEAFRLEAKLIREMNTHVSVGGANFTWGGEGASGRVVTEETRESIRRSLKGHAVSDETRKRISGAVSAWLQRPDSHQIRSDAQRRRFEDPEQRASQARFTGHTHTESARRAIGDANRCRKKQIETRQKLSVATKQRMTSPEARQAISRALTGIKRSEETKAKLREAWSRRKALQELVSLTEEMGLYELELSGTFDNGAPRP